MAVQIPQAICLKRENQTRFLMGYLWKAIATFLSLTGRGSYITPPREEG